MYHTALVQHPFPQNFAYFPLSKRHAPPATSAVHQKMIRSSSPPLHQQPPALAAERHYPARTLTQGAAP